MLPKTIRTPMLIGFTSLAMLASAGAHSSGTYQPKLPSPPTKSYAQGKALFQGQKAIPGAPSCASCHAGADRLHRGQLRGLGKSLESLVMDCDFHDPCYRDHLNPDQLNDIIHYLRSRYRL